jgi:hypothetical protein
LCFGQPRMGQDRYGRPQGAVVATGERDCHATAHRYVRPKSIGQVLYPQLANFLHPSSAP